MSLNLKYNSVSIKNVPEYCFSLVRGVFLPPIEDPVWNPQSASLPATPPSVLVSVFLHYMPRTRPSSVFSSLHTPLLTLASRISQIFSYLILGTLLVVSSWVPSIGLENVNLLQRLNEIHTFGTAKLHTGKKTYLWFILVWI